MIFFKFFFNYHRYNIILVLRMNFDSILSACEGLVVRSAGLAELRENEDLLVQFSSMLHYYWQSRTGRGTPAGESPLPEDCFQSCSSASYQLTTSLSARSLEATESLSTLLKSGPQTALNFDSISKFFVLRLKNPLGELARDSMLLITAVWIDPADEGLYQGLYVCSQAELFHRSSCFSSAQIQQISSIQGFMLDFESGTGAGELRDRIYKDLCRKKYMLYPRLRKPVRMQYSFFKRIVDVRRFLLRSYQTILDAQFAELYAPGNL